MTPDEAVEARLRQHLADAPNTVAARARAAAELVDLTGLPVADARDAVDKAFSRMGSGKAEDRASKPGPADVDEAPVREAPLSATAIRQETRMDDDLSQPYTNAPEAWERWWRAAELPQPEVTEPPGPTWDGRTLAELVRENAELKELLGGPDGWSMSAQIVTRQRQQWIDAEARRRNAATGWYEPQQEAGSLADELDLPRSTPRYRIAGLAGFGHNVLVAGERKVGKSALMVNLAAAASTARPDQPGRFLGSTEVVLGGNIAYWAR